jgi:hypothetical protein
VSGRYARRVTDKRKGTFGQRICPRQLSDGLSGKALFRSAMKGVEF